MKRLEIRINNEAYPCRPTMGAMLRFKQETGREVTEINPASFSDLCTYLWCCITSASKREGKKFDMSLMDFADSLTPEDMAEWTGALQEQASGKEEATTEEKKTLI